MNRKSVKLNTVLNTVRMMLTVLVPLVTFPYTSRIFLTEGNGRINFATSVVQIFILLASLGIYSYGVREGTKVRNDKEQFSKLAKELLLINLISTVIAYSLFFVCVFGVKQFRENQTLLLINGIMIGFTALGLDWIYGVYEEYTYITIRQIFCQVFTIVAMFLFVQDSGDIYLWAFLTVISSVGANIFNFVHARKYISIFYVKCSKCEIKKHLGPVIVLFTTQLATKVYSNITTILLGLLSTNHSTGIYSAAVKINTILITCFTAMSPVFMPRIVEYVKTGREDEYHLFLKKIFRMIISIALPAVIGIEMLSEQIIVLLAGSVFVEAASTMRILAPIILISACSNILYFNVLVPAGKEKCVLICTLLGASINLSFSWVLIPIWQQNGAAVSCLIAETVAFTLALVYSYRQDCKLKKSVPQVRNYVIGGAYIAICCFGINKFIRNDIVAFFISIGISILGYAIILLITKDPMGSEGLKIVKKILLKAKK